MCWCNGCHGVSHDVPQGCFNAAFNLRDPGLEGSTEESALVIDAKALYDSLKAEYCCTEMGSGLCCRPS